LLLFWCCFVVVLFVDFVKTASTQR
jgi:hypothetical protein